MIQFVGLVRGGELNAVSVQDPLGVHSACYSHLSCTYNI